MGQKIPPETLVDLKRRLSELPPRDSRRRVIVRAIAESLNLSESSIYRALRTTFSNRSHRSDKGKPRILSQNEMEKYCEIVAALRIRTTNKKGRQMSTSQAIRILEETGVQVGKEFLRLPKGVLNKTTVNRYLRAWKLDAASCARESPSSSFQAEYSNDCWQFDLSPSDLKHVDSPPWIEQKRGKPTLMIFSIVDDRSGTAYQEYRCVYGEDVEAALRFLFNAMSPKASDGLGIQGIPKMIYADNGPISKSRIFRQVLNYLGVQLKTHLPKGKCGNRTGARSKGKVERPFRTVKQMHETLYHFHKPSSEEEANLWLVNYLKQYNQMAHRSEPHSRLDDWLKNQPPSGIQGMCSWEKYCSFAREPEERKVAVDGSVSISGVRYSVDLELIGEWVRVWWGLLDQEIFIELDKKQYGPFYPSTGPIPLHRYRSLKKTKYEETAERLTELSKELDIPRESFAPNIKIDIPKHKSIINPYIGEDPFQQNDFNTAIEAKKAVSDCLGIPLAKLTKDQMKELDQLILTTMNKKEILDGAKKIAASKKGDEKYAH